MPTEVKMPQMGESIYEGTITRWMKKEGDSVRKDEPMYELSTDKVDTEIPSPVTGVLVKIAVPAGKKVPIHTVVAMVDEQGKPGAAAKAEPKPEPKAAPRPEPKAAPAPKPEPKPETAPSAGGNGRRPGERVFASPLVRRMAREEGIDLARLEGSGPGGRITKDDVVAHLEARQGAEGAAARIEQKAPAARTAVLPVPAPAAPPAAGPRPVGTVPMTPKRLAISEHMVRSKKTSAHVHTVFEVDLSRIVALREREKDDFERVYGTRLTFTPFFAAAAVEAIKEFPIVNSSVQDGTHHVYHSEIHLGIAVAQPDGLIVPVIKKAEEKSFLGLCRAINDLAERARTKKLSLEDIQGGTFTITNPGIYGGLFGTPVISQPQVAILGIGGIEKRPVVVDDAIAIRPMAYLALGFDHRVIDGATADQFMARLKQLLVNWSIPIK